ncbi:MAG: adhesin, partial [Myxococcaceae bacterium]|nr:adhesin [Myxococcaceae bacterium]
TVDSVAPAAPVVQAPANGSTVTTARPPITGTAEAGSTVTVRVDGMVIGTTTATAGGTFSFTPTADLSQGSHTVNVTATDAGGNVSPVSNTNTFTVDSVAPAAPVVQAPANGSTVTTARPPITGTAEAGSTVTVRVDGVVIGTTTATAGGTFSFTPTADLSQGSHTVNVTATDAGGNVSPVSNTNTFTVNPTPGAPVITSPVVGSTTRDPRPPVSGTAPAGSTVTVRIDGAVACTATADAMGAFSCTPMTALGDGPHVATAVATTMQGSSPSSAPVGFNVDTVAPLTPVVVGPANGSTTSDATPTVTGTGEPGSTITVRIDGTNVGTTTVAANGTWSFDVPMALSLSTHTVSAIAADAAGNTSLPSNTNTFTVVMPGGPVVVSPADNSVTRDTTPALSGTAGANEVVTVKIDGVTVCTATADAAGAFTCTPTTPLGEGGHALTATTPDGAGGVRTSNTNTFTVDTTAPAAPVVISPANGSSTTATRPTFTGTAEPFSTVTVTVDGMVVGTATATASGAWALVPAMALSTGAHTVSATATDRAGNVSQPSATNTFTVTSSAPALTLQTPVDGSVTRSTRPVLSGTAAASARVEARVDGMVVCTATADAAGLWSCTPGAALTEGRHVATATVAGSMTPSNANAFTIDSVAPAAPVVTAPADQSFQPATPTVTGTAEPGSRVTVSIDGTAVCVTLADAAGRWSCTPPAPLAMGMHTVNATATDPAGNVSPTSNTNGFTVDTTAPAGPVLTAPANGSTTSNTRPAFTGTAEAGSTVVVSVDGAEVCRATATAQGTFTCTPATALALACARRGRSPPMPRATSRSRRTRTRSPSWRRLALR